MRAAEWISLSIFSLLTVLAWLRVLKWPRRAETTAIGAVGVALSLGARCVPELLPEILASVVRDLLPAPLMLMVYWQAGRFFQKPNEKLQARLASFDHHVFETFQRWRVSRRAESWIAHYLELAYLLCYPLLPLGIGVLYVMRMERYADEYWTIVLPPTYLCYVALPFMQTLPPRMLVAKSNPGAAPGSIRRLNLWILRHGSIQVNTFPSAHVAATTAASLALLHFAPPAGLIFLWLSLSIAVGAVVGRYHYTADALLAAALAVVTFLLQALLF